ncbi:MAG: sulfite exporter TauE/SafE family protein [Chloroflexi bacterium]|nr:sulfite exporter TauE/SafE family protein [Chloroflexota bacterium]
MEYIVISVVALFVSSLTLFSGFGLGTVLMPAFALFFPIPVAIAATAVVHLANNIFKVILTGRHADWGVVIRFAITAALAAILGAWLLGQLSAIPAVTSYQIGERTFDVTLVKLVIGLLIIGFSMFDLIPKLQKLTFDRKYLPLGGILSGFFGGLSGNQGAMRSAFLIKSGLDTKSFVGTNGVCAFLVDLVRLLVYGAAFYTVSFTQISGDIWKLVLLGIFFAFIGSFVGARLVKKITLRSVQHIVGVMLVVVGIGLATGLL